MNCIDTTRGAQGRGGVDSQIKRQREREKETVREKKKEKKRKKKTI